jgi:integrase
MAKVNAKNERIKRDYFHFLEGPKRMAASSVEQIAAAISAFEASTNYKDFRQFHIEQARRFKRQLDETIVPETGKPLAKVTTSSRLRACKAFFQWLAMQPGYRSKLTYSDSEYFNASNNDGRVAAAKRERPIPTVEQIRHVLNSMPDTTEIQKRNRALIAFTLLSGARDSAIASLSLKHIDVKNRTVFQDARDVKTKFAKTMKTIFFPVGDDIELIVNDWITYLEKEELFCPTDPLFPATKVGFNDATGLFGLQGLTRDHWSNAAPIRTIFRDAFEAADLPYMNPHSFRNTLALLGEKASSNMEVFKSWSQNLGHEHLMTTLMSYGTVPSHRQAEIMENLAAKAAGERGKVESKGADRLANLEIMMERLLAQQSGQELAQTDKDEPRDQAR